MISDHPYTKPSVNIYTATLMALLEYGAQGDTAAIAVSKTHGGLFHLTDETAGNGYRAFVVNMKTLQVLEGVWTWDDEGVIVNWSTGDRRHYVWDAWKANVPVLNRIRDRESKKQQGDGK